MVSPLRFAPTYLIPACASGSKPKASRAAKELRSYSPHPRRAVQFEWRRWTPTLHPPRYRQLLNIPGYCFTVALYHIFHPAKGESGSLFPILSSPAEPARTDGGGSNTGREKSGKGRWGLNVGWVCMHMYMYDSSR